MTGIKLKGSVEMGYGSGEGGGVTEFGQWMILWVSGRRRRIPLPLSLSLST